MRVTHALGRVGGAALLVGALGVLPPAVAAAAQHRSSGPQPFKAPVQNYPSPQGPKTCSLGQNGQTKHVVILDFDNVHLQRDNPNVPSDIEQIPALYNFLKDNGTLLSNDHTGLISHTADGITSTETGLYPGDEGLGVSNSFEYLNNAGGTSNASAFTYWTDPTGTANGDSNYTMLTQSGKNTPAPWVTFTRAGCDFAGIGSADMEFENDTSDLSNVYGTNSWQYQLGSWSYNPAYYEKNYQGANIGTTDFEGLAIHCSYKDSQPGRLCGSQNGGITDKLPDEPGGYTGYNGLFGALTVNPVLTGKPDQTLPSSVQGSFDTVVDKYYTSGANKGKLEDVGWGDTSPKNQDNSASTLTPAPPADGDYWAPPVYDVFSPNANNTGSHAAPDPANVDASTAPPPATYTPGQTDTSEILDEDGTPGFPGFDGMEANNALGYTAAAQEAGVPVTYTYLSDVHDDQYYKNGGDAYGPGEAGHEAQLREYNAAFTAFFHRLAADGINKSNTLFLVTVDEGDHYVGAAPSNPTCDGVTVACNYGAPNSSSRNEGEIDIDLDNVAQHNPNYPVSPVSVAFGEDYDDAPAVLVPGGPNNTQLPQDSSTVRDLEYDFSNTDLYDPAVAQKEPMMVNMADQTEEGILHMLNGDSKRDPTFTLFGDDDFYFEAPTYGAGDDADGDTYSDSCDPAVTNYQLGCPKQNPAYAWNHGDIQPQIASTWQGWVGPGIAAKGQTGAVWTDHTDVRPTLMALLGLRDDYASDGTAIADLMTNHALPNGIRKDVGPYEQVESDLKLVNAPFSQFGMETLNADTHAISTNPSSSSDEAYYQNMDSQLQTCESARESLVKQMQTALMGAEDGNSGISHYEAAVLTAESHWLLEGAQVLQSSSASKLPKFKICGV